MSLLLSLPFFIANHYHWELAEDVFLITLFWPCLALQAKRWHDRGKSAWWILITFIPIIGGIWIFIELGCLPGKEGYNPYDPEQTPPAKSSP